MAINFVPGVNPNYALDSLVEQRVTNVILQEMQPNMLQDELRILRNDEAFGLGITPPVIPGN